MIVVIKLLTKKLASHRMSFVKRALTKRLESSFIEKHIIALAVVCVGATIATNLNKVLGGS